MSSAQHHFDFPQIPGISGAFVKMVLPLIAYAAVAPLLWLMFRRSWRQLDDAATDHRMQLRLSGQNDVRPWAMFAITAFVLTAHEYYGGHRFYSAYVRPWLTQLEQSGAGLGSFIDARFYAELYGYGWWSFTRVVGYTIFPLALWKLLFPKDSLLDMGLRTKGLTEHAWIYGACLAVVVPLVFLVSRSPEFASYYPFYKSASRSWLDFAIWEVLYIAQFFALELFFRGFMLSPLRKNLGSGAIFAMCVPYVMIHYGKPYLESSVAFVAGVALGSLAMRTRSVYWGFFVHVTVALFMDVLALVAGGGLPTRLWPR
ncbi:MAG: CPBP family intramembrane metalloprotease [Myxococcales bacterium]|nr:CPBP family intramembrane metalloprotease [Myxococcales bacterium]